MTKISVYTTSSQTVFPELFQNRTDKSQQLAQPPAKEDAYLGEGATADFVGLVLELAVPDTPHRHLAIRKNERQANKIRMLAREEANRGTERLSPSSIAHTQGARCPSLSQKWLRQLKLTVRPDPRMSTVKLLNERASAKTSGNTNRSGRDVGQQTRQPQSKAATQPKRDQRHHNDAKIFMQQV